MKTRHMVLAGAGLLVGLLLALAVPAVAQSTHFKPEHFSRVMAFFDGTDSYILVEDDDGARLPVDATLEAGGTVTANQGAAGATAWPVVDAAGNVLLTAGNALLTTANGLATTANGYLSTIAGFISGGIGQVNVSKWGGTATTLGQKAAAASVPATLDTTQNGYLSTTATQTTTTATNTGTLAGAVALGHMQADVLTLPAVTGTVTAIPPIPTAAGALIDPDQNEAAADFLADATGKRKRIVCWPLNVGTVLVREGAATGGTAGAPIRGGAVAYDGTGIPWMIESSSAVYVYDLAGAGNADQFCTTETLP